MICVINIGNTNTAFGFGIDLIEDAFVIPTHAFLNSHDFQCMMKDKGLLNYTVDACIVASVRPDKSKHVVQAVESLYNVVPYVMQNDDEFSMDFSSYEAHKLGIDRKLALYAAKYKFGDHITVVDLGTATTINVLNHNHFEGGAIFPGVRLGLQALGEKTGLLPSVDLNDTTNYIGLTTTDNIRAGAIFGTVAILGRYYKLIEHDFPKMTFVITGGNAKSILPYCKERWEYVPNLVLCGILTWWNHQGGNDA